MTPIEREKRILLQMMQIYCRHHHNPTAGGLCIDCNHLIDYAFSRLDHCPDGIWKPSCRCCNHGGCYTPSRHSRILAVMRFSGPRMFRRHPISALRHLIKEFRYSRGNHNHDHKS